jgi:uncharacterized FlaG/YvyC family protein
MNDWQKDWWQQVEKASLGVEKFFEDLNQAMESFAEEVTEALTDLSEQLQDTLTTEVDRYVEDFIDLMKETNQELEFNLWQEIENLVEDSEFVEITTEMPTQDKYAACMGCRHYHGQAYNGQILVCGMHPYGVEEDTCGDWEN